MLPPHARPRFADRPHTARLGRAHRTRDRACAPRAGLRELARLPTRETTVEPRGIEPPGRESPSRYGSRCRGIQNDGRSKTASWPNGSAPTRESERPRSSSPTATSSSGPRCSSESPTAGEDGTRSMSRCDASRLPTPLTHITPADSRSRSRPIRRYALPHSASGPQSGSVTGRDLDAAQSRTWSRLPDALARAARSDLHVWADPGPRRATSASGEAELTLLLDAARKSRSRADLRRTSRRPRPRRPRKTAVDQPIRVGAEGLEPPSSAL
jgi:hypothetical protein